MTFLISKHLKMTLLISKRLKMTLLIPKRLKMTLLISKCLKMTFLISKRLEMTFLISKRLKMALLISKCLKMTFLISNMFRVFPQDHFRSLGLSFGTIFDDLTQFLRQIRCQVNPQLIRVVPEHVKSIKYTYSGRGGPRVCL